jgi:hypothetical protein
MEAIEDAEGKREPKSDAQNSVVLYARKAPRRARDLADQLTTKLNASIPPDRPKKIDFKDPWQVEYLMWALSDPRIPIPTEKVRAKATQILTDLLKDRDGLVDRTISEAIVEALGRLDTEHAAQGLLCELVGDKKAVEPAREAALTVLGRWHDSNDSLRLCKQVARKKVPATYLELEVLAIRVLGKWGEHLKKKSGVDQDIVMILEDVLDGAERGRSPTEIYAAMRAYAQAAPTDSLKRLFDFLESPNRTDSANAIIAFHDFFLEQPDEAPHVVRDYLKWRAGKKLPESDVYIPPDAFLLGVGDYPLGTREEAQDSRKKAMAAQKVITAALAKVMIDEGDEVRKLAARFLGKLCGPDAPKITPTDMIKQREEQYKIWKDWWDRTPPPEKENDRGSDQQ